MADLLKTLTPASWRDIQFPITGRDFGFQQEHEDYRFLFKDDQLIESLGRQNPTWRYQIPFRQDIRVAHWRDLFSVVYPQFLAACFDRSRGTLVDPIHGEVPAKCISLSEKLDVNRRDGVDVEVEFMRSPSESDVAGDLTQKFPTFERTASNAKAFDAAVTAIPWRQKVPPEPTINPIDAVSKFGGQFNLAKNQVTAALADTAFRTEKAIDTIDSVRDPQLAPLRLQARRLQADALDAEDRVDVTGIRPLRRVTVVAATTVSVLAQQLGIALAELIRLNPVLARSPLVPAQTIVKTFADTERENARAASRSRTRTS